MRAVSAHAWHTSAHAASRHVGGGRTREARALREAHGRDTVSWFDLHVSHTINSHRLPNLGRRAHRWAGREGALETAAEGGGHCSPIRLVLHVLIGWPDRILWAANGTGRQLN